MRVRRAGAFLVAVALTGSMLQAVATTRARPANAEPGKPPEAALTEADAVAAARKWRKPVRVTSRTSTQRDVVALPDGRLEMTLHTTPVRTLRDGRWTPIDTALRRSPDGSWSPAATTVGLVLSGGGKGPFVRMTRAGRELAFQWPYGNLPAPTVQGDSATYPGVLTKDVDLVVRATPSGFTHVLVVKTPAAARLPQLGRLRLKLDAPRMSVGPDGQGGLKATDAGSGGVLFQAGAPEMWDSSDGTEAPAAPPARSAAPAPSAAPAKPRTMAGPAVSGRGPGEASKVRRMKVGVGGGEMTLEPDQGLLTAPDTRFPVYIDPDWTAPGESAAVMVSTSYTDASWTDEGMGRCADSDPYMSGCGGTVTKRLFYKFALPSAALGTNVVWAEFKPRETWAYNCTPSQVQVWKTKGVSGSTSWGTQNASGFWQRRLVSMNAAHGNEGLGCADATLVFASEALKEELHNTAKGGGTIWLGLRAGDEGSTSGWKRFDNDATLRVLYNLPPRAPTDVRNTTSEGNYPCLAVSDPARPRIRKWPRLRARISDPQSSDKVQAEYWIGWGDANNNNFQWRYGGPGATNFLRSAMLNSGSDFEFDLEAWGAETKLPKNVPISWIVRGHDFQDQQENGNPANWMGVGPFSDAATSAGGLGHKCAFVYDNSAPPPPTVQSTKYPNDGLEHDGVGQPGTFTITPAPGEHPVKYGYQLTPPGQPIGPVQWLTPGQTAGCTSSGCTLSVTPGNRGDWKLDVWAVDGAGLSSHAPTYQFRVRQVSSEAAHWRLDDPVGSTTLHDEMAANDTYQLISQNSGKCLNVEGGLLDDGVPVLQWDCVGVAWERWKLVEQGGGEYTLVSLRSGKCLVVEGGSLDNGAHAVQRTCGGANERWKRVEADGGYQLVAVHSNKCLNVQGGLHDNGMPVLQWDCVGVAWERWRFAQVNRAVLVGPDASLGHAARTGSNALRINTDGDPTTFGYVETTEPVIDPAKSYAISAWVRPTGKGSYPTVAGQDGTRLGAFRLEYASHNDHWSMTGISHDGDDAVVGGQAYSLEKIKMGQWVHLVGVYDSVAKTISLYVDGRLQETEPYNADGWIGASRGSFTIGRWKYHGVKVDPFFGEIDDVRVFNRTVTGPEVAGWYRSTVQARWTLNSPAGVGVVVPDAGGTDRTMTLYGGAEIKTDDLTCVNLTGQCLSLDGRRPDGTGEWAMTPGPVVRTDESFTVAGWVEAARPTVPMTLFAVTGTTQSAFTVRFNPRAARNPNWDPDIDPPEYEYIGAWELEMATQDGAAPTRLTTYHGQSCNTCINEGPDHIAMVYDAATDTMSLYVNGNLDESVTNTSWRTGVVAFHAGSRFQIGRRLADGQTTDDHPNREYLSGLVDDVWVIKGALTQEQLAAFANLQELDTAFGNPQLPYIYPD
ncbi:hypothetical protein DPM19_14720 [Actinomadura craniellae]|uniref:Uncharacterized protein n=1 Tax=Actinomadura craniellae TaxID=2231787 RepID=A0A365H565_9ACTN|nr:RICIN domain-containing protein [Actinomadura craniellae]RAY14231.1 hypothetical protein DPM19_14720 [Actinomadura craniellae]